MTLTDVLRELGIDYREPGTHHHAASRVAVDCPFCSPRSSRFRMGIILDGRPASCWTCGFHNVAKSLAEASGKRWGEVNKLLAGVPTQLIADDKTIRGKLVIPKGVGPLLKAHRNYLRNRGFNPDQLAKLWGVGGIGNGPELPWRVFIPVHDVTGKIVSWTTRKLADEGLRYINAKPSQEEVAAKSLLYGEVLARHSVVVHEGPTDPWATGPGAVATMGLIVTKAQLCRIAKYPVRVICFDNEPDAQLRADKLCDELAPFPGKTVKACFDRCKDAGEALKTKAGRRELRRLRKYLD